MSGLIKVVHEWPGSGLEGLGTLCSSLLGTDLVLVDLEMIRGG